MRNRVASAVVLSLSLSMLAGSANAETKLAKAVKTKTTAAAAVKVSSQSGSVISAGKGKLMITGQGAQKEHSYEVPATAKVTIGGKAAKLEDLKKGTTVTVTTDAKGVVESISST